MAVLSTPHAAAFELKGGVVTPSTAAFALAFALRGVEAAVDATLVQSASSVLVEGLLSLLEVSQDGLIAWLFLKGPCHGDVPRL